MTGKSYVQNQDNNTNVVRKVTFSDDSIASGNHTHGLEKHHNLLVTKSPNPKEDAEYSMDKAPIIVQIMYQLNQEVIMNGTSFGQQFILQVGLKRYGKAGYDAAVSELEQLYKRSCFTPISIGDLSQTEKDKAMKALMLLTEKRDGSKKRTPSIQWQTD